MLPDITYIPSFESKIQIFCSWNLRDTAGEKPITCYFKAHKKIFNFFFFIEFIRVTLINKII